VIVSEFQFFKVVREFRWIHPMIFHQSFFDKRPETFDTIDVDFPISEPFTMIDPSVFETVLDKTVITSEPVRVDQTSSFDFFFWPIRVMYHLSHREEPQVFGK